MIQTGEKVKVVNPDVQTDGYLLSQETVDLLKSADFTGQVTQIQDGHYYVTFTAKKTRVTQVFKPEEVKAVE